ncbi:hypothetical protein D3C78_835500 [compost metagenome]
MTLLATSCRRITKVLLPVWLSADTLDTLKVQRASTPSPPWVPPCPANPLTSTLPAKSAPRAPLPVRVVMIW